MVKLGNRMRVYTRREQSATGGGWIDVAGADVQRLNSFILQRKSPAAEVIKALIQGSYLVLKKWIAIIASTLHGHRTIAAGARGNQFEEINRHIALPAPMV